MRTHHTDFCVAPRDFPRFRGLHTAGSHALSAVRGKQQLAAAGGRRWLRRAGLCQRPLPARYNGESRFQEARMQATAALTVGANGPPKVDANGVMPVVPGVPLDDSSLYINREL